MRNRNINKEQKHIRGVEIQTKWKYIQKEDIKLIWKGDIYAMGT